MRNRLLLLLVALPLLLVLALPAVAVGSPYPVKNTAGHKVGSIAYQAGIRNNSGVQVGQVSTIDGYWCVCLPTHRSQLVTLTHTSRSVWSVSSISSYTTYVGRAKHIGSRWILQKKVNGAWTKKGSVSGSCHGNWAAGALRSLLW